MHCHHEFTWACRKAFWTRSSSGTWGKTWKPVVRCCDRDAQHGNWFAVTRDTGSRIPTETWPRAWGQFGQTCKKKISSEKKNKRLRMVLSITYLVLPLRTQRWAWSSRGLQGCPDHRHQPGCRGQPARDWEIFHTQKKTKKGGRSNVLYDAISAWFLI